MGCWNGTDIVTKLPIMADDEIYFMLMTRSPYQHMAGGKCYSTTNWYPVGLPIKGKYDDYGCMDEVLYINPFWEKEIEKMNTNNEKTLQDKSEFEEGVLGYLRSVERGARLHPKAIIKEGEIPSMSFVMVDSSVYETIAQNYKKKVDYDWNRKTFEDVKKKLMEDAEDEYNYLRSDEYPWRFDSAQWLNCPRDLLTKYIRTNKTHGVPLDQELIDKTIQESLDFYHFICFLCATRNSFDPQSGAGSQSQEYDLHALVANMTYANIRRQKKRWEDFE